MKAFPLLFTCLCILSLSRCLSAQLTVSPADVCQYSFTVPRSSSPCKGDCRSDNDETRQKITELQSSNKVLQEQITAVNTQLAATNTQLAATNTQIGAMLLLIRELETEIDNLRRQGKNLLLRVDKLTRYYIN